MQHQVVKKYIQIFGYRNLKYK